MEDATQSSEGKSDIMEKARAAKVQTVDLLPAPTEELVKLEDMKAWDFDSWQECATHLIAEHSVSVLVDSELGSMW